MSAVGVCYECENSGTVTDNGRKRYCSCPAGSALRIVNVSFQYAKQAQRQFRITEYLSDYDTGTE